MILIAGYNLGYDPAYLFIYLITSTIWYRTHNRVGQGSNLSVSLQITQPAQERLALPPGSTSPTLFEQWCWFFYIPQGKNQVSESV